MDQEVWRAELAQSTTGLILRIARRHPTNTSNIHASNSDAHQEKSMPENKDITKPNPNFLSRVWRNDGTRKGLAAAGAGVIIAAISELVWPNRS